MSRDEIKEHAEHIMERMRGESHHIPTKVRSVSHSINTHSCSKFLLMKQHQ